MQWLKNIYRLIKASLIPVRTGAVILAYHSIGNNKTFFTVSTQSFRTQMQFLRSEGWHVVSLNELGDAVREGALIRKKTVAVTFDDAYSDFVENALPILVKYDIPATLFVPTELAGKQILNKDGITLPVLGWDDISILAKHPLVSIGSHSMTHPHLNELDHATLVKELEGSKVDIEMHTNTPCTLFAYPRGRQNVDVQNEVSKRYVLAVGTDIGRVTQGVHIYNLPRKGVYSYTTFGAFRLLLKE